MEERDLASAAPSDQMAERLRVVDMLLWGTSDLARTLGQPMAFMVQVCRQVWQLRSTHHCIAVLVAPVVPGEIFGPVMKQSWIHENEGADSLNEAGQARVGVMGPFWVA